MDCPILSIITTVVASLMMVALRIRRTLVDRGRGTQPDELRAGPVGASAVGRHGPSSCGVGPRPAAIVGPGRGS